MLCTSNILRKNLYKITSGIGNHLMEMNFFTQNFNKEKSTLCLYAIFIVNWFTYARGGTGQVCAIAITGDIWRAVQSIAWVTVDLYLCTPFRLYDTGISVWY